MTDPMFVSVSVAGRPSTAFCLDPQAADPVAAWYMDHDWIDEPVQRAFLDLVRPGWRVLDLGSHLGTFSLPAAALGAKVLAVDANPEHTRLLALAAEHNGFNELSVANTAVAEDTDGSGFVRFEKRSIHGHVLPPGVVGQDDILIATTTVGRLLGDLGWDGLDLIKMDIEGCETAALRGMADVFATGCRPAFVLECNGSMLRLEGSSAVTLRRSLEDLGYRLYLIDHLNPGVLVETSAATVQTESASDLLAVIDLPEDMSERWTITGPLGRRHTIARLLDQAASPAAGYRSWAADLLRSGPAWLHNAPVVGPALAALDVDMAEEVRHGGDDRGAAGHEYLDALAPDERDEDNARFAVWVEELSMGPPRDLELPLELRDREDDLVVRRASFHVRRGEQVALLATDPKSARSLLHALDGSIEPVRGRVDVCERVVSLVSVGAGLEPSLSVWQNVVLFGSFLGCTVAAVEERVADIVEVVGAAGLEDAPLYEAGSQVAARLAVAVALECTRPDLLLMGRLPAVSDGPLRSWLVDRAWRQRANGTAIVQVVHDQSELLIQPDRALWLDGPELRAAGHVGSVFEEGRLGVLGFHTAVNGWKALGWPS